MAKHLWGVSKPAATPITGIDFPSNGDPGDDVRFMLSGADLLPPFPATYIWKLKLRQQNGYYTTFFWGPNGSFTGAGYYGFHPYPNSVGSADHKWEISAKGQDVTTDPGHDTTTVYDVWIDQAARITTTGDTVNFEYYWDLSDVTKMIPYDAADYASGFPSGTPALMFGSAVWSPGNENLSGVLRGIQAYDSLLSVPNMQLAATKENDSQVLALALDPWYLCMNPTPSDISDKSGNGHEPEWVGANRPTLWEG